MAAIDIRPVAVEQTRALRRAVLRPHESLDEIAVSEPEHPHAVGVFEDGALVAVGLIGADPEQGVDVWRVRGMAAAAHARGRGHGTAVLAALLDHAAARGAQRVWCNVRTPARALYERAGFEVTSDEFELPQIGRHVVMELVLPREG